MNMQNIYTSFFYDVTNICLISCWHFWISLNLTTFIPSSKGKFSNITLRSCMFIHHNVHTWARLKKTSKNTQQTNFIVALYIIIIHLCIYQTETYYERAFSFHKILQNIKLWRIILTWRQVTLAQKKGANLPPQRWPWHSSHIWSSSTYGLTSTFGKQAKITLLTNNWIYQGGCAGLNSFFQCPIHKHNLT